MAQVTSTSHLIRKLRSILRRQRLLLLVSGLLATFAVVISLSLVLTLLAHIMVLPVWFKALLLVAAGIAVLFSLGRFALARLFGGTVDGVALKLEHRYPDLKGRLIATVQFSRIKQHPGYSSELLAMTRRQALEQAERINFSEAMSFHPILRTARFFVGATLLALALLLVFPGLFGYSYEVYSHISTEVAPPLAYELVPVPGSVEWLKYRDITIGAAVFGQRLPEKASIHHRLAGGSWQKTKVDLQALPWVATQHGDSVQFGVTLRQISKSFEFYAQAGRLKTRMQRIDVVDRPRVVGINLAIFYPSYTGLSPLTIDENNGSFSAVTGSRINMRVETNLPVESASLAFEDSSLMPLTVEGKVCRGSLLVDQSRSYHIRLVDHLGERNPDPIEYYITAVPDEYPSVDVLRPGFDVNLNDDMMLPLKVRIYDDYGFSSLVLKYTLVSQGRSSEENVAVLHFSDRIKTEGDVEFNWDMEPFHLFPGDYITYYFEVADNDVISGPKISQSRQYVARLPSLDELITQAEADSHQRIVKTEDLIRSGRDIVQRIKNVARKLEARETESSQADWQHQKELKSIAEKSEETLQRIEKMAEEMESALERTQENALLGRKIMEYLAQIQKLFEEVATPEMREAQRRLMEALQRMDRQQLQQAVKDFEMSQDELLARLERTLALLKRMQLQQKMEAMIRKAEQLAERQKDMNERTEEADKESLPGMGASEDEIRESFENLKAEVAELREIMKQAQLEQSQEVQRFAEAVEKSDADSDMRQMARSLQDADRQAAGKQGKQAYAKLMDMLDEMQEQYMALTEDESEQIKRALRRAIDDANYLSQNQEDLIREAASIDPRSLVLRETASAQQDLARACTGLRNTIAEIGKQSPFVAAELQGLLNGTVESMAMAVQEFENKRGTVATRSQRDAMVGLNKAALRLMESLDQLNQCENAKQCNQGLAKLESLCNKQNQLNQQCQNQCTSPHPKPGGQEEAFRDVLERLAGEQGSIRKSLEQLKREFGDARQILGRLDDIAGEMKEVEESLAEGQIGEETTQRQLRILSRMLEATRSLQRKDYSDQRQATAAEKRPVYVPPSLPAGLLDERIQLEDRLRDFLGSGYPPQYEERIKAYFRALLKAEMQRYEQSITDEGK